MLRRLHISLLLSLLLLASPLSAANPEWEHMETLRGEALTGDDERLEVSVRDSYIYLTCSKPVTVKIFTILGQPVAQGKVPAGVSRIRIPQRGVYILKAGSVTRRVNI